jgi:tubulin-specific chaperone D
MSIALDYMRMPNGPAQEFPLWSLRYVLLLWLSLICMIPFDLEQLDDFDHIGHTADAVEALAKEHLGKAGLEREASAILLSRFYMRYGITFISCPSSLIPAGRTRGPVSTRS